MATWVEDITQALNNLDGKGSLSQIFSEVEKIRQAPLPKNWKHIIQDIIYKNSSDTQKFQGNDLFQRIEKGVWALKDKNNISKPTQFSKKYLEPILENYQILESLDEIANTLRTIKEYRDYQDPDSNQWKEYVKEFFHILGFSTDDKSPRLMTLNVLGTNYTPKAIVCYVEPGENFDVVAPGFEWESFLFYAAKSHQIDWGIITDGLRLKIIHYLEDENQDTSYWPDLDGVVSQEKLDTFCTIYKVFSYLKGNADESVQWPKDPEYTENHKLRRKFWGQLLDKAKTKTQLHAKVLPKKENWVSASAGKSGLTFVYFIRMDDAQVELYIDRNDAASNKIFFNTLLEHKVEIEKLFGCPLDWQLLPYKRASRIRYVISDYGLKDQEHWDELQDLLIDAMIRLERALRTYIHHLD